MTFLDLVDDDEVSHQRDGVLETRQAQSNRELALDPDGVRWILLLLGSFC